MAGVAEDLFRGRPLDDMSGVHDHDLVGDFRDHPQVMANELDGHAELGLNFHHQLDDLGLDGDVQGRGRLVGDQKLGPTGERHGDHRPLPHAAGHLVWIVRVALIGVGDTHPFEHHERCLPGVRRRAHAVQGPGLRDLRAHGQHRVERRHRLLENHGNTFAADGRERFFVHRRQVQGAQPDGAAGHLSRGRHQAEHGEGAHRLAAARLADHPQRSSRVDGIADPSDRAKRPLVGGEGDLKVVDRENRPAVAITGCACGAHYRRVPWLHAAGGGRWGGLSATFSWRPWPPRGRHKQPPAFRCSGACR